MNRLEFVCVSFVVNLTVTCFVSKATLLFLFNTLQVKAYLDKLEHQWTKYWRLSRTRWHSMLYQTSIEKQNL